MKQVGNLTYNESALTKLCEDFGITYLALFGSYLHGNNKPESDVDLLVKFKSIDNMGLFKYVGIQNKMSNLLEKKVDLIMKDSVDPIIKHKIFKEAQTIYQK